MKLLSACYTRLIFTSIPRLGKIYEVALNCIGLLQVFDIDQAPAQDAPLSVEPVQKGRELSERINALITDLRRGRAVYPQCFVVRQGKSTSQWCCCCALSSLCSILKLLPSVRKGCLHSCAFMGALMSLGSHMHNSSSMWLCSACDSCVHGRSLQMRLHLDLMSLPGLSTIVSGMNISRDTLK